MLEEISSQSSQLSRDESPTVATEELLQDEDIFMEFFRARQNTSQIFMVRRDQRQQGQRSLRFREANLLRGQLLNYNRKEKSLEQLSRRFLQLYVREKDSLLELDKITLKLGVERRRIYDIINILQSLKVVLRTGKNLYKWNGLQRITKTIEEYELEENGAENSKFRKEKSLQVLSIGFLKLFIHWRKTLSLEEAAKKLVGEMEPQKLKTKVRRLYDIANVFKSLGLVKKTYLPNRKPGFEWIGVSGLHQMFKAKSEDNDIPTQQANEPRSSSFFQQHIMKYLGVSKVGSLQSLIYNWQSHLWSGECLPLSRTRSMGDTSAQKNSNSILKQRTNQKTAQSHKSAFGSFRKIDMEVLEPKVLF